MASTSDRSMFSSGQPGAVEARHVDARGRAVEPHDVGLQALEAARRDLGAGPLDVGQRADRVEAGPVLDPVGETDPPGAAMRPVEPQPVAHRAAEQLVHRNAERLCLDVDEGVLDRGDRLLVDAVGGLPGQAVQEGGDLLDWPRIHADQPLAQSPDDAAQALGAEILHELRPADQAVVGGDLQEREIPPAGVAVQVLDFGDPHDVLLRRCGDVRADRMRFQEPRRRAARWLFTRGRMHAPRAVRTRTALMTNWKDSKCTSCGSEAAASAARA